MPDGPRAPAGVAAVMAVVVRRIRGGRVEEVGDRVAQEYPVTLACRGRELATLMCTPEHLDELALGFLYTGGLIVSRDEVQGVTVQMRPGGGQVDVSLTPQAETRLERWEPVRLVSSGCGQAARWTEMAQGEVAPGELPRVSGDVRVGVAELMELLRQLARSPVHGVTGGTHAAALAQRGGILCLREDVGRHNAVDKVAGWWLARTADHAAGSDLVVLTTGRLSSDLVLKVSRLGAPVLVSRAAPTSLGIRLAYLTGITLVGFARAGRLNVYTFPDRVLV